VITGIVLAAGSGRRFGDTKQCADLEGRPLVQHAVQAAADAALDEIIVVLGHRASEVAGALTLPPSGRTVVNERHAAGQATSLHAGLRAAHPRSDAAVVLLADQPGIDPRWIAELVSAFDAGRPAIARIRFRDAPGPALLARGVWARAMLLRGDAGARALIDDDPTSVLEVRIDANAPADIDTPEDLRAVREARSSGAAPSSNANSLGGPR
jgi:molybdenum cofactor cytidylyltransferase